MCVVDVRAATAFSSRVTHCARLFLPQRALRARTSRKAIADGSKAREHQRLMSLTEADHNPPKVLVDPEAIDRRTGKPKQISKRAKTGIRLILQGEVKSQSEAAKRINMNESHFSELIHSPAGRAFIARERSKTIAVGSLRAAARLVDLVDAASEHVAFNASQHILAIEGIRPPEQSQASVNIHISPGYVINHGRRGDMARVSGNDAKPLIELEAVPDSDGERER